MVEDIKLKLKGSDVVVRRLKDFGMDVADLDWVKTDDFESSATVEGGRLSELDEALDASSDGGSSDVGSTDDYESSNPNGDLSALDAHETNGTE